MNLKIGCDPELFLTEGGKPVSAHGVIPGTKENPHPVEGGAVQVDGMALEFNIDPADNEEEFVNNIQIVMNQLGLMLPEHYDMAVIPTAKFDPEYLINQPPMALMLGCEPDYSAWREGKQNNPPNAEGVDFRTAAGHIHIGWTDDQDPFDEVHLDACIRLSKELDAYLGLPSVMVDRDNKRRKLYGQPGAFRPKPYGVEYRVLSNFWIQDEKYMRWVYNTVNQVFNNLVEGKSVYNDLEWDDDVQFAIIDNDHFMIENLCRHHNIGVPA